LRPRARYGRFADPRAGDRVHLEAVLVGNTLGALAAKAVTATIPIVFGDKTGFHRIGDGRLMSRRLALLSLDFLPLSGAQPPAQPPAWLGEIGLAAQWARV